MSGTILNAGVPSWTTDVYSAHTEYTFLSEKPKSKEETINKNVISVTCKGNGENKSITIVNEICKFKMSRIEQDMLI